MVTKVEETRPMLLRVRFEVKKIIYFMGRMLWPFVEFIQDIKCGQHSISVWGNLKGGNPKIVGHPLVEWM